MKSNIEEIYIDEAGNTGQDLLNKEQKVFVLASNNFSINQLDTLSGLFPNINELHFIGLKGSSEGRSAIINFLNHPLITEVNIQCFTAHKEYMTVGHIVDRLIEPVHYNNGIDIYREGMNIAMTNYIYHFGIGGIWDSILFNKFLTSFISMAREKTQKEIDMFYADADELYQSIESKEKILLLPVLESRKQIKSILAAIDKFALDVTLSAFYVLCDQWHKATGNKLRIFQDDSKQIAHYKEHIDFTINLDVEKQDIGYASKTMVYPTQIEDLVMVSSQKLIGVQISDLIASSIAFMYNNNNKKQEPFVNEIKSSRLLMLTNYYSVWPNLLVTPKDLNMESGAGQNPLDFLAYHRLKQKSTS